ncbi:hypothetical protein [Mycolicibacter arupensis]|uniref:Uncharacterized protein n=1 Tax=Mycolicibacter arupensis TaxID=342002 RepID=A0A5C7XY95_9MYCO|nr:hypothetical protein [Mycolicibacter arupensis]MCV7277091.1 hypothetical protein [Mycolicibacter arupensis]OQZ93680.1 hypothetical protein BST15_17565 [Mycolicibacter arupensis]TXI54441.1 MAG: hypothetical protein E6Q54_14660 [Mycolicibacter arupensis]
MDDIDIPQPNPALTAILASPRMFELVRQRTEVAKVAWQAIVAKRSRRLAASARVTVGIGGKNNDRPVGRLTVGDGLGYGASHEFGHRTSRSTASGRFVADNGKRRRGVRRGKVKGAKELKTVLRSMRSM